MRSLNDFIVELKKMDELIVIDEFVSPELEICEFADRTMKQENGGKALLFSNNGTKFPLLINHYGSDNRILKALNLNSFEEPAQRIDNLMTKFLGEQSFSSKISLLGELKNASKWIPRKINKKGKCQEVIISNPDLDIFPILKCWPHDGGRFITLPMVITEDPETKQRNIGMYRMQIFDKQTTGMHWHLHKGGAAHFEKYKKLGQKMPITVVLGGEPALTYSATAPLPEGIDEFILAAFLSNNKIKLVKSITNDIYIPESVDIVIEGYIDTNEEFALEGPFGDHSGFYSLPDMYPKFHVTAITHRKDAIYPATIVGVPPMEDFYLGKATEKIFIKPIQIAIAPEIIDMRLPSYGVAHNIVFIKAKTSYCGQSFKILNALVGAGQMMFSKAIILFDDTTDIHDDTQVLNKLLSNVNTEEDIVFTKGPSDVLDHATSEFAFGNKILIDATNNRKQKHNDIAFKEKLDILYTFKSILLIKNPKSLNINELATEIISKTIGLKFLIVFDSNIQVSNPYILIWLLLGNIDPSRDFNKIDGIIVIDARTKTDETHGFKRAWPNVCISNHETINKVNILFDKIPELSQYNKQSPSLRLTSLVCKDSAWAENSKN